ncbi:MAG: glycoside hydrolase family 16 protein [bacterium]|nr:glycoside hydrolase family 16 protein [bacterium]
MKLKYFSGLMILVAFGLSGCASEPYSPAEPPEQTGELTLVWRDEFNGDSLDTSKWTAEVGDGCPNLCGWGNEELEYYRSENAVVADGNLAITAREESYGSRSYTSARIKTQGKFTQTYGRFEARIKLPVGQGIWPAFWLLGADINSVGWPDCGEIDIMEYRGQAPNVANGALHGPGYSGGNPLTGSYTKPGDGFNEDFHVFAVEWNTSSITWFVDGYSFMTKSTSDLPGGSSWVFDDPFFIIMNLAVGGNYVGNPNQSTEFPQTMLIDYVRVYSYQ